MRTKVATLLLLLSLASLSHGSERTGTCFITFFATSTFHDFTGTVRSLPFTVIPDDDPGGGKVIRKVAVDVPVDGIDTDNGKRNRQLRKMFDRDTFPLIHGEVRNIRPDRLRKEMKSSERGETIAELNLNIREVEQAIAVRVSNFRDYPQQISFDLEFPVSLAANGLKPPSPLFGLIRVGDRVEVKVTCDLEVRPADIFSQESEIHEGEGDAGVAAQH
ncbi:MAG: hypothetical protein GTO08_05945 [Deltaproteobacteria bacterium]|nr:hypothetical protein [Deltaproteobacteria bacterium]